MRALISLRRVVRSSMCGQACLTNRTFDPAGVHSRRLTSAIDLPIAFSVIARKSSTSWLGSSSASALPSSAEAIRSSSVPFQPSPTPRVSHTNRPWQACSTMASCSAVSCWFSPSVSMIACLTSAVLRANRWLASVNQVPMAVPPLPLSRLTAAFASSRVSRLAGTSCTLDGNTMSARPRPATIAKGTPSRSVSMAATVARLASVSFVYGLVIEPEQSIMMTWAKVGAGPPATTPSPDAVTVTTASTTVPPAGRYGFWNSSALKTDWDAGWSAMSEFLHQLERIRDEDHAHVVLAALVERELHQALRGGQRRPLGHRRGQVGDDRPVAEQPVAGDEHAAGAGRLEHLDVRLGVRPVGAHPPHERAGVRVLGDRVHGDPG